MTAGSWQGNKNGRSVNGAPPDAQQQSLADVHRKLSGELSQLKRILQDVTKRVSQVELSLSRFYLPSQRNLPYFDFYKKKLNALRGNQCR
jgi:hypothetical protein